MKKPKRKGFVKVDPMESAKAASLRYVDDSMPGIQRLVRGKGFSYRAPDGSLVRDRATLKRIAGLVIPPAWTKVWICPTERGHIQATGRDARGRKQYRYHARFREVRDQTKYEHVIAFAEALPAIRERVEEDLSRSGLVRERVLATVVRLLDTTLIRVGNEEYARDNASFGLTTLRTRHVDVSGSSIRFKFRGKSGKEHAVEIHDRRIARIIARCTDLPGQILFQYLDDEGKNCAVESAEVNDYLRTISGADFTAKDFRTWAGTVLCASALAVRIPPAKTHVTQAIKEVSERLRNTPAVCKRCYVHPEVLAAYFDEAIELTGGKTIPLLSPEETAVLAILTARRSRDQRVAA